MSTPFASFASSSSSSFVNSRARASPGDVWVRRRARARVALARDRSESVSVGANEKPRMVTRALDRATSSNARAMTTTMTETRGDDAKSLGVRATVECATLASLAGLAFHVSSVFRFDAYLGALFPLPVVIASARMGTRGAMRTLVVATLLLATISGPLRAMNYLCLHGALAYALGGMWTCEASWWATIPASALVRTLGILTSLGVSSLVLRENVMRLLVTQMYSMIDQFAAGVGATFAPTMTWIWATALFFILINSFSYTLILHMVYAIVLNAVTGKNFVNAPRRVCRALGVSSAP